MKYLWFLMLCWQYRNTPRYEMVEQYELTIKAARRCAYDLAHCASDLSMVDSGKRYVSDYHERALMWQELFTPTGGKDYRHRLHSEIRLMESKLNSAIKLLDDNGIDHNLNDIPF